MPTCIECGSLIDLPRKCRYCNEYYCTDHRLPESHGCDAIDLASSPKPVEHRPLEKHNRWREKHRDKNPIDEDTSKPRNPRDNTSFPKSPNRDRVNNQSKPEYRKADPDKEYEHDSFPPLPDHLKSSGNKKSKSTEEHQERPVFNKLKYLWNNKLFLVLGSIKYFVVFAIAYIIGAST